MPDAAPPLPTRPHGAIVPGHMISRRRAFVAGAVTLLAAPLAAEAQRVRKVPRVGVLADQSPEGTPWIYGLRDGLRELGYIEGQNVILEWRWAQGRAERFPDLAADLVRLEADIIVAANNPATAAAQKATRTIPIVMVIALDPVGSGFATSLARPGGNITGLSIQSADVTGKRLQLLKEAVPSLSQLVTIWDPTEPGRRLMVKQAEAAAPTLALKIQPVEIRSPSEIDGAFARMAREGMGAVLVQGSSMLFNQRGRLAQQAVKSRLPTMCASSEWAEGGCLLSYGVAFRDQSHRAAYFVDKILKGATPGDLPVEQPTKFELVINLKTAKALGLTIPPSLLLRADQVIE